jgi:hypothetical protein
MRNDHGDYFNIGCGKPIPYGQCCKTQEEILLSNPKKWRQLVCPFTTSSPQSQEQVQVQEPSSSTVIFTKEEFPPLAEQSSGQEKPSSESAAKPEVVVKAKPQEVDTPQKEIQSVKVESKVEAVVIEAGTPSAEVQGAEVQGAHFVNSQRRISKTDSERSQVSATAPQEHHYDHNEYAHYQQHYPQQHAAQQQYHHQEDYFEEEEGWTYPLENLPQELMIMNNIRYSLMNLHGLFSQLYQLKMNEMRRRR